MNKNTLYSLKSVSVFINIPKHHKINDNIIWMFQDINYNQILKYILYLDKEIKNINYKVLDYPYLNSYCKVTDYNIMFHYSNLSE